MLNLEYLKVIYLQAIQNSKFQILNQIRVKKIC